MVKRTVTTIALFSCLVIGLASTSSANDRQEVREAAGVEAGDRVDRRREVRDNVEADVSERKEVREAAGVEAGDRIDRRKEVREAID
jgi:hypothetical protein